jgi:YVTN family beta-propeller protein
MERVSPIRRNEPLTMASRFALLLACLLLPAPSPAGDRTPSPPQASSDGEVYVYLQPLPPDAARIAFSVESASALDDRGNAVPFKLSLPVVTAQEARRQRLFAGGRLPAGSYAGVSVKIQKASLKQERGETSLLVPDSPLRVDVPFVVSRGRALVLWLTYSHTGSVSGGINFSPAFSAHVAPVPMAGRAGFVSSARANVVTMFDKRLRQAAAVIPVPGAPSGMALDQRAGRLYVACPREDEVRVIDVAAAEQVEESRLSPGDGPREVALTPDGRTLLSVNAGSNSVNFFDAQPLSRLDRINVGNGPASVAIDPAGRRAFVFNTLSSTVSVIDIAARSLAATISIDSAPLRGHFTDRGDRLYVIHERSPYITVVDPRQLTVVTRARLRMAAGSIKVDSRRNQLYLGGRDDAMVEFYEPSTMLPVDAIRTRRAVSYLTIDGEDNTLYMVSPDTRSVVIGSLADRKLVSEIDVGEGPYWVAVMGER